MQTNIKRSLLLGAQIAIGTAYALLTKYQSQIEGIYRIDKHKFNHPFNQVFLLFFSEALAYPIFLIYKRIWALEYDRELRLAKYKKLKTEITPWIGLVPASFDLVTSTFGFLALYFLPVSVYQMTRALTLVITAIFQWLFLKRVLLRHQMIAMAIIVLGDILYGGSAFIEYQNQQDLLIGIIMLCICFLSFSAQIIVEEKYFNKYYLNAFQLVGFEGFWGMGLSCILLLILQIVPCPNFIDNNCPTSADGKKYLAQTDIYLKTLFSSGDYQPELILSIGFGVLLSLLLSVISAAVTKYMTALTQNVVQISTIAVVWVCSMIFKWEEFIYGQLCGLIVATVGFLMYGGLLILKCAQPPKKERLLTEQPSTSDISGLN